MRDAMLNLVEIRAFVTVARTGSVQAASARLNLTQSAVSRLVQRLESDLRTKLFDRSAKPLVLTQDGRVALEHGLRVLSSAEALAAAVAEPTPCGKLRIGTAHALAASVAGRPLERLRAAFPEITLQISVDWAQPLVTKVEEDALDAAFLTLLTDTAPNTELPARFMLREAVCIVGAADYAAKRTLPLAALDAVGWAIQPEGCGYRTALERASGLAGLGRPRIVVETLAKESQLSIVGRGSAFCLLPASQAAAVASDGRFTILRCPELELGISTWFVRKAQPGRFARALDVLERSFEELQERHVHMTKNEFCLEQAAE